MRNFHRSHCLSAVVALFASLLLGCPPSPPTTPTVDFSADTTEGYAPLTVAFTNLTDPGSAVLTGRRWDFGDGFTATEIAPTHVYSTAGLYTVSLTVTADDGATYKEAKEAYINAEKRELPTADFTVNQLAEYAPVPVLFTDTSSPGSRPITSRTWDFGDGQSGSASSPTHVYAQGGTYRVTLRVASALGADTKSIDVAIKATAPPTASFEAKPARGYPPLEVTFTNTGSAGSAPATWQWFFGDGSSSTEISPTHTYKAPGTYDVSLFGSSDHGSDTVLVEGAIEVLAATPPAAAINAAPRGGVAPLEVYFADASEPGTAVVEQWLWDFGDGDTATTKSVRHVYTTPGTYDVSLWVKSDHGEDSVVERGLIVVEPPVTPTAAFAATPTEGVAPLTVQFTDQSVSGTTVIESWLWDFGDGAGSGQPSPAHVYEEPGTYAVSLKVASQSGEDTLVKEDYIAVRESAAPTADFSATPTSGPAWLDVQFSDQSIAGDSPTETWLWNFGDGTTSSTPAPTHRYKNPGVYAVSLTVGNEHGEDSLTREGYVEVTDIEFPVASFEVDKTEGVAPLRVKFINTSDIGSTPLKEWTWQFGDGNVSHDKSPTHDYTEPGVYDVSLSVETAVDTDTIVRNKIVTVRVFSPPNVDFTAEPIGGYAPLAVDFTSLSAATMGEITEYTWDFGDGEGYSSEFASTRHHVYELPGTYTVSLTVDTTHGADTLTRTDYITVIAKQAPKTEFVVSDREGFAPFTVVFTDRSEPRGDPVDSVLWDFGNGSTSSAPEASHGYTEPGIYTVKLTASAGGRAGYALKHDYIEVHAGPAPAPAMTVDKSQGYAPLTVRFTNLTNRGAAGPLSYRWDFDDGTSSTETSPVHTYTTPGVYSVSLVADFGFGTARAARYEMVTVLPDDPPVPSFEVDSPVGFTPHTVVFEDSSVSTGGPITGRIWDFGDGTSGTGPTASHTYTSPGSYDVTLEVSNSSGSRAITREALVRTYPREPLVAEFDADCRVAYSQAEVGFRDRSVVDAGITITSWSWDFGDGQSSTQRNPKHHYESPGEYTVRLSVRSAGGVHESEREREASIQILDEAPFSEVLPDDRIRLSASALLPDGRIIACGRADYDDGDAGVTSRPLLVALDTDGAATELTVDTPEATSALTLNTLLPRATGGFWVGGQWGGTAADPTPAAAFIRFGDDLTQQAFHWVPDGRNYLSETRRAESSLGLCEMDDGGLVSFCSSPREDVEGHYPACLRISAGGGYKWLSLALDPSGPNWVSTPALMRQRAGRIVSVTHSYTTGDGQLEHGIVSSGLESMGAAGGRTWVKQTTGGEWPPVAYDTTHGSGPVAELKDGGIVCQLSGEGLSKRDAIGDVVWSFSDAPGARFQDIWAIVPCRDGGFLVLYKEQYRFERNADPHMLAKYDAEGRILWHRTIWQPAMPRYWRELNVHETPNGDILLVGWGTEPHEDSYRYRGILTLRIHPEDGDGPLRPEDIVTD